MKPQSEGCDADLFFLVLFPLRTSVLSRTDGWNPQSGLQEPQSPSRKRLSAGGHSHPSPFTFSLREEGGPPQCSAKGRAPVEFAEIAAEACRSFPHEFSPHKCEQIESENVPVSSSKWTTRGFASPKTPRAASVVSTMAPAQLLGGK